MVFFVLTKKSVQEAFFLKAYLLVFGSRSFEASLQLISSSVDWPQVLTQAYLRIDLKIRLSICCANLRTIAVNAALQIFHSSNVAKIKIRLPNLICHLLGRIKTMSVLLADV